MSTGRPWLVLGVAMALASAGCAASLEVRDAGAGRVQGLDKRVAAAVDRGKLGKGEALDIAHAVARGEILRATGWPGLRTIGMMSACTRPIRDALEERADKHDDVGREAALSLVEAGIEHPSSFDADASSPDGAFRAVAARGLVDSSDAETRRARILDGDQEVRLAALRAAADARDPADFDAVLEAARVDPYPLARAAAVRALGQIGGERASLALKDIYAQADEPLRLTIAQAWSMPRSLDAGGRHELAWAAESQHGSPGIAAAYVLLPTGGTEAAEATMVLERAIASGPTQDRIFAILVVPLAGEPARAALTKASDDPDEAVAVASLGRRLQSSSSTDRAAMVTKLTAFAQGTSRPAISAKIALARAGVRAILPVLFRDVRSADPRVREGAGLALAELGEFSHAAVVAVDRDEDVRTRVACAMLAAR